MFRKDCCGSGAIYRMCLAGVHSLASFVGLSSAGAFISTVVFSSADNSASSRLSDSRLSETVSINLIASRSMGTPNIRVARISNRRNEPAVSMRAPLFSEEAEKFEQPPRLEYRSEVSRSIPLNNGLRDADERNQSDNRQNLYQHGIPQSHNLLLRGRFAHNPIAQDRRS